MTWNRKYWDIVDNFFWSPKYLGLRSIPQRLWSQDDHTVCVPSELVNRSGPLYTRDLKAAALMNRLAGSEEVLNQVFDITFAIAPDHLISTCFCRPLGWDDVGPFESIGREILERYRLPPNVTQQDGLYVSPRSAVAVELKIGSATSSSQLLKYACMLAWEEAHSGRKEHLGLLFIVPEASRKRHWSRCDLEGPTIDRAWLVNRKIRRSLPRVLTAFLETGEEAVASILDRLHLAVMTWDDLKSTLDDYALQLDPARPGDQSLQRLIAGFVTQLEAHRGVLLRD